MRNTRSSNAEMPINTGFEGVTHLLRMRSILIPIVAVGIKPKTQYLSVFEAIFSVTYQCTLIRSKNGCFLIKKWSKNMPKMKKIVVFMKKMVKKSLKNLKMGCKNE